MQRISLKGAIGISRKGAKRTQRRKGGGEIRKDIGISQFMTLQNECPRYMNDELPSSKKTLN
jgi:hypothetical protein